MSKADKVEERSNGGKSLREYGGKKGYYEDRILPNWDKIAIWARSGLSDPQIAENCRVGQSTFSRYMAEREELAELVREARDDAIPHVENALFKRAIGYEYTETTKELVDGTLKVTKKVRKQMAPDTSAAIYWLEQRAPKRWTKNPMAGVDIDMVNTQIQGLALLLTRPVPAREVGSEIE